MRKTLNILVTIAVYAVIHTVANAQSIRYFDERAITSHYFFNPSIVNPGALGWEGSPIIMASYRSTWASIDGAPSTLLVNYNAPAGNRLNVGASLIDDKFSYLKTTKLQGALSYNLINDKNRVSFGLSADYIKHSVDAKVFSNKLVDPQDPVLREYVNSTPYFETSLGIYGRLENNLEFGASIPALISTRTDNADDKHGKAKIGYIFNLGYKYQIPNTDISLKPSIYAKKIHGVPFHSDINIIAGFLEDKFHGGILYRVGADKMYGAVLGFKISSFDFLYSYQSSSHEFQQYNNGTHELSLKYQIIKAVAKK